MEDYLNGIDEDIWRPIRDGPFCATTVDLVGTTTQNENIIVTRLKKEVDNKRCICKLRGVIPPVVYNYIRGCKTPQEI